MILVFVCVVNDSIVVVTTVEGSFCSLGCRVLLNLVKDVVFVLVEGSSTISICSGTC